MLENWKRNIEDNTEVIFLPFDFSDQYLGCIRMERLDVHKVKVNDGVTLLYQGHSLSPSNEILLDEQKLTDFRVTSESFQVDRKELLDCIQHIIDELRWLIKLVKQVSACSLCM